MDLHLLFADLAPDPAVFLNSDPDPAAFKLRIQDPDTAVKFIKNKLLKNVL